MPEFKRKRAHIFIDDNQPRQPFQHIHIVLVNVEAQVLGAFHRQRSSINIVIYGTYYRLRLEPDAIILEPHSEIRSCNHVAFGLNGSSLYLEDLRVVSEFLAVGRRKVSI